MKRQLETLDLNLLLTLHWVLTEQNVSRAAERLGVSQPAVSHGLKRLRDLFGDPLLVKSGRVMRTTPKAERMKPKVVELVAGMRDLFQAESEFEPARAEGRFRIAASDNGAILAARAWLSAVSEDAPGLALDVVHLDFPVAQDLISGAVDLVLMPEAKLLDLPPGLDIEQFVQKPLWTDEYLTGVPAGTPRAEKAASKGRTLDDFLSVGHVLTNPAGASLGAVDDVLRRSGKRRRIAYRTESFTAATGIARATGCLLTAPRSTFAAMPDGFVIVPPPLDVKGFRTLIGWHPNWTSDARHRWLRERLTAGLVALLDDAPVVSRG